MALSGCYGCLKCLMVVFNLIYWALGATILTVSIMLLSHGEKYVVIKGGGDEVLEELLVVVYVLFAMGAFLLILGFLGCCGAIRESPSMLTTFFIFMLCAIVVEVGFGAHVWSQTEPLRESIKTQLTYLIRDQYKKDSDNPKFVEAIDALQQTFHCCGILGPSDWANSVYNGALPSVTGKISEFFGTYSVPASCCVTQDALCEAARQISGAGRTVGGIYKDGCLPALFEGLKTYAKLSGSVVAVAIGFQIFGMILALVLCFASRRDLKD